MIIALEKGQHKVSIQEVIECFLPNGPVDDVFGYVLFTHVVGDFVLSASKIHIQCDFIFEHIVRGCEIVSVLADLLNFGA